MSKVFVGDEPNDVIPFGYPLSNPQSCRRLTVKLYGNEFTDLKEEDDKIMTIFQGKHRLLKLHNLKQHVNRWMASMNNGINKC